MIRRKGDKHMKKLISIIVALLLVFFTTTAMAEEFTLRNGIAFGDSMETVLAKETLEVDDIEDGSDEGTSTDTEDDDSEDESELPYYFTTCEGTVAGIENSYIKYNFDANKTLREVIYYFESYSSKDTSDSDYESINDGLIRKYGSPLGYSNGDCYIFSGAALESAVISAYIFSDLLDGYGDIRDYDEWDVETGDYHVKIEQVQFYYGSSYSDIKYAHQMSYTYFTDDDLQAEKDAKRESQEAVDNDL